MYKQKLLYPLYAGLLICLLAFASCRNRSSQAAKKDTLVNTPEKMRAKAGDLIRDYLADLAEEQGKTTDGLLQVNQVPVTEFLYRKKGFELQWSVNEKWLSRADSILRFITEARLYGLFPDDYHLEKLQVIRRRFAFDSLGKLDRKDAALWAKADIMLTDALVQLVRDVKLGRLPNDSITLNKDTVLQEEFYLQQLDKLRQGVWITDLIHSLEPQQRGYQLLKSGIPHFLDSADFKDFTFVSSGGKDSLAFKKLLQKRLHEGGYIAFDSVMADSSQLAAAVKKFQKEKGIAVDGRAGEGTLRMLNLSDKEKFIRIAISLDKYKKLPPAMPDKYIWVNTASNYLDVIEDGEVKFSSKVISGKPKTRTPLLNSGISALITYPQWVPPASIIAKEILPAVKKNPGYLERKGFSLVDSKGNEVDPYTVDWSKYNKTMPYRVVQGSGDENALGVLKFHFDNKYSVYLHDTNQRYLFSSTMRSLSHGCVRVQEWEKLVYYILGNDSLNSSGHYSKMDSVRTWLKNKEKHSIGIRNKMPVFIRYFTCEGRNDRIVFYDDVYGEDKSLREKYFTLK